MDNGKRIAVLMGGDSSEREISLKSGNAVLNALKARGYEASSLDPRDEIIDLFSGGYNKAFIALHGRGGEDGTIQGLLEVLNIPYTGSGVLASAVTMDKSFSKQVMAAAGIPTPDYAVFTKESRLADAPNRVPALPLIVKPASEGSTIGVSRVEKREDLILSIEEALSYGRSAIVEKFIEGREVTVGVLNGEALPVVEIVPKKGFYDYEAKYTKGMTEYRVPADLDETAERELKRLAVEVYRLFECRGAARVDIMIGEKGLNVLEINTIPGMTETSLLPIAASSAGIGFEELVEMILKGAALDGGVNAGDQTHSKKTEKGCPA